MHVAYKCIDSKFALVNCVHCAVVGGQSSTRHPHTKAHRDRYDNLRICNQVRKYLHNLDKHCICLVSNVGGGCLIKRTFDSEITANSAYSGRCFKHLCLESA